MEAEVNELLRPWSQPLRLGSRTFIVLRRRLQPQASVFLADVTFSFAKNPTNSLSQLNTH